MRHGQLMGAGSDERSWHRRWCAAALVAGIALGTACASMAPLHLTPITQQPTQLVEPGRFVWVDLVTQDVARARSFYGDLFGWTFRGGDGYTEVLHDGTPIAGIVAATDPERGSEWLASLSVADVDRASALASEGGGIVERGPLDVPDRGRLALVSDPEGALLLLLRASTGDPPDADAVVGGWLWIELWTHDADAATRFYAELVGYEFEVLELDGHPYHVFAVEDEPRAGVVDAPPEVNPLWLPYVRVEDPEAIASRAAALGARVVMRDDQAAILVDPTGAPIAVQVWPPSDEPDTGVER
jgi:predicted enzyme related to lactoylglutathione lyase